jgi:hypothetical protein
MKSVLALATLAAIGFTGAAFAQDVSKGWSATTATAPKAMSDSDMDKVTAGLSVDPNPQCADQGRCFNADGHIVGGPADNGRGSDNPNAAKFSTPD